MFQIFLLTALNNSIIQMSFIDLFTDIYVLKLVSYKINEKKTKNKNPALHAIMSQKIVYPNLRLVKRDAPTAVQRLNLL